jgi:hypothetical protein
VRVLLLRRSMPMMKIRNVLKPLPRVVALLAILTATFAVAQESPQPIGSPGAGVSGGASAGAASHWGVHAPPANGASTWEVTRNASSSSRFVPGGGGAHPLASVQDHPVSAGGVPRKREAHPSSRGIGAGGAVASSGAATGGTYHSPFSGGSHVVVSHRSGGHKAPTHLIAQQLKGHSTASRHHGGGRGQSAKSNRDSEPVAPRGERGCDKSSKLELCTWL